MSAAGHVSFQVAVIEVRAYLVLDIGLVEGAVKGHRAMLFEINSISGETVEDKRGRKLMRRNGGGAVLRFGWF